VEGRRVTSSATTARQSPPARGAGAITARGVTKTFVTPRRGEVLALADVDLDIAAHQFVAILGPSGCGKTTLLNMIAGFERPTGGLITLDGHQVTGPGPDRGVVFQDHALFPWLNVEQNVGYGLRERGIPPANRSTIVDEFLELAGLSGFQKRYPHELSGGMRQRVGLVRVLANDAAVLLMDEPFASVDAQTRRFLQREIERIWTQRPKTVVFITHSVEEAIYLGDVVVVMTARPGTIKSVSRIDLVRPRDVTSVEFNQLRRRAEAAMDEESTKARVGADDGA
jgi:NitT/TauT family transport system ATP-binding protein